MLSSAKPLGVCELHFVGAYIQGRVCVPHVSVCWFSKEPVQQLLCTRDAALFLGVVEWSDDMPSNEQKLESSVCTVVSCS